MKKLCISLLTVSMAPCALMAQSATDAYNISQSELRGTARFMSMAGAFGALGGDLSSLSQNPGGIGIYRSHEIGITFDIDRMSSKSTGNGYSNTDNSLKFYVNNVGAVASINLNNSTMPFLNLGFTYNRAANFRRTYSGDISNLPISLSNYIAGVANSWHLNENDLKVNGAYDPYNSTNIPWISILGYDSYLITPEGDPDMPQWYGQYGRGTSGSGRFSVEEKGSQDEYNIVIGGNINNIVYWGMNFDITTIDYRISSLWGEDLQDAYVYNENSGNVEQGWSRFSLKNQYSVNGTGFNYQLGVIVRPIQELRLGLAFHTPTYYQLTENFYNEKVKYESQFQSGEAVTNNGIPSYNNINFRSPLKLIASVAGVIGSNCIISADYEWQQYSKMKYSYSNGGYSYGDDYWWDDFYDPWYYKSKAAPGITPASYNDDPVTFTNNSIAEIYQNTNTFRIGAEYRVLPAFSLRAGYSYTSSPVTSSAKDHITDVPGAGTMTNYRLDNATNYVTAGCGYRYKGFYADLAYVYKHQTSDYFPFSPDPSDPMSAPNAHLSFNSSQIVMSVGVKF